MALALVPAAIAWACNPQAYLQLNPTTVTPGGQLTVSGAFFKGSASLTLSLEPGGQVATVTTAGNGSFSTSIAAPSTVGSYTLTAIGYEPDGSVITGLPARASFSVAGAASQPTPSGAPATPGQQPATSAPAGQEQGTAPSTGQFAEPEVPATREFPNNRSGSRSDRPARKGGGGSDAGSVNAGAGVIDSPSGAVFAGSVAREDRASVATATKTTAAKKSGSRAARGSSSTESAPALSERSAAGDVWSGFDSSNAPSLMPSSSDRAPSGGAGSALAWGIGLLGLGLVSLVGGLAATMVRRRARARG